MYFFSFSTHRPTPLPFPLPPSLPQHFPSMWWHAVLNLEDYNVFVSTFTQE